MLRHYLDDLVDRQGGAYALRRATDRGRTAPPGLELVELDEGRLDVRELRLEGADREFLVRIRALLKAGIDRYHDRRERVPHAGGRSVCALHDGDLAAEARLGLDLPRFQGGDHVRAFLFHGVAVLLGLLAREQPLLHGSDAIRQGDPEVHDGGGDGGQRTRALGRGALLRPRVVPGGEGLRAGVPAPRELVGGGHETDPLHRGLQALALRPEGEDGHRAHGVDVRADCREGGALGRQRGRQRVLDGRAAGVVAGVLRVEVADAALRERGHRHLDSVHGSGEYLVVGLVGLGDVAGVEYCEIVHQFISFLPLSHST